MTAEVVWLDSAERDLKEVYRYILEDKPHAAVRYIEDIVDAIGRLAHFPESARRYNLRYRVLVVRNHLVFYRFEADSRRVVISAIVDGRRDVASLIGDT